jgi:hypothetical protein
MYLIQPKANEECGSFMVAIYHNVAYSSNMSPADDNSRLFILDLSSDEISAAAEKLSVSWNDQAARPVLRDINFSMSKVNIEK